jgi:hypothetical protein
MKPEDRGSTIVKVLRYKSEGRCFDPRWSHGIFRWHKSFWSRYGPGVDSASNGNEYHEYFLGVNAAGSYDRQPYHHPVPLSRNLGTLISWNPLGQPRPITGLLYLCLCNQTWTWSADCSRNSQYTRTPTQNFMQSSCDTRTGGRTNMTQLTVAFCNLFLQRVLKYTQIYSGDNCYFYHYY